MAAATQALVLHADLRDSRGKESAKKMRGTGRVPAVIYGAGKDATAISFDDHEFRMIRQATHGDQVMIEVQYADGKKDSVFVKDILRHPVTDAILHADLLRLDLTKKITIDVKVMQVGAIPIGVKEGGLLEALRHTVTVRALPQNIPSHIEVDLSGLDVNNTIHVAELPKFDGVEYLDDQQLAIFTIISKARIEASAAAAEADAAAAKAAGAAATPAAGAAAPAAGTAAPAAAGAAAPAAAAPAAAKK